MNSQEWLSLGLLLTGLFSSIVNIFIFYMMRKMGSGFRFVISLAVIDIISSFSTFISGVDEFIISTYIVHDKSISAVHCLYLYPYKPTWTVMDVMQACLLILFAADRFLNIYFSQLYNTITRRFSHFISFFLLLAVLCSMLLGLSVVALTFENPALVNETLCETKEMMGEKYFQKLEFVIKIFGLTAFLLCLSSLFVAAIRFSRKIWCHILKNESESPVALTSICLFRSGVLCGYLFIPSFLEKSTNIWESHFNELLYRFIFVLVTSAALPVILFMLFGKLRSAIIGHFNKYNIEAGNVDKNTTLTGIPTVQEEGISMSVWSTGDNHIGQIEMESMEDRARREKSISFYRDVRDVRWNLEDETLSKLRNSRQLAEMNKQNSRQHLIVDQTNVN